MIKNPILQKAWKVITWRWRLQLAINAPFGLLWVADKTNPAVHAFDMSVLAALHAEWLAPMMGVAGASSRLITGDPKLTDTARAEAAIAHVLPSRKKTRSF